MNLKTYLDTIESGCSLAAKLGVTPVQVSHWRTGFRPIPLEKCAAIEQATGGLVNRQEMRPLDYMVIWPEITAAQNAEE